MTIKERIAFHRSRVDVETDLAPQLTRVLALVDAMRGVGSCDQVPLEAIAAIEAMEAAGDIEPTTPPTPPPVPAPPPAR